MATSISLTPEGRFLVTFYSGRSVEVEVSERGAWALHRLLYRVTEVEVEKAMGVASAYPTQHLVDAWLRDHKPKRERELASVEDRYGIDLSTLSISI